MCIKVTKFKVKLKYSCYQTHFKWISCYLLNLISNISTHLPDFSFFSISKDVVACFKVAGEA